MDLRFLWWKIYVWIQVQICCRKVLGYDSGSINQLSKKDIVLLAADEDPKCFTRTQYDLTCFWEVSDEKSYNFFYSTGNGEKLCILTQQKIDNTTILHVCSFPASDVYLFTLTYISVVETSTNSIIYCRNISVEDQVLLDPPTNVSLHMTEEVGQLQVTWRIPKLWRDKVSYEIRYSYNSQQKTKQVEFTKSLAYRLDTLVPGEVCSVQMRVALNGYSKKGHWSAWSHPTMAMVPQPAAHINLLCHTSDLRNIKCQWNESGEDSHHTLFYKPCPSSAPGQWRECTQRETAGQCVFTGEEFSAICVNITSSYGPLSRIFYSKPFRMNDSVKTDPPWKLREKTEGGRLAVQWEPPQQNLSGHLMYQIRYHAQGESLWKLVTLQSSKTSTFLDVQAGSQYSIQIKAKPDGSIYSGFWSDWSNTLTVDVPSNMGTLLVACIPFMMLFISVFLIATFSKHFSKMKQHLWPPVPNLDRVLEGFLTDINRNCQNSSFNIKQCYEDTIASMVEIVSEREALVSGKIQKEPVTHVPPEPESEDREMETEHVDILEASQDYVTLNVENLTPCLQGNEYVYEGKPLSMEEEVHQMRCHCTCAMSSFPPPQTSSTSPISCWRANPRGLRTGRPQVSSISTPTWRACHSNHLQTDSWDLKSRIRRWIGGTKPTNIILNSAHLQHPALRMVQRQHNYHSQGSSRPHGEFG
ncbi:hypothetical protein AAFF_G00074050 [Aldrovandia affinis]|uniref:Fibronectin type-III domain-containing protein n=1 Tax=Aldrovandia affinis TaxID=143900 RepID=A0AAD7RYG1_9TELE|nr:hypothetical protein AAFF_G00074050 [Aldrovandia affinis]